MTPKQLSRYINIQRKRKVIRKLSRARILSNAGIKIPKVRY